MEHGHISMNLLIALFMLAVPTWAGEYKFPEYICLEFTLGCVGKVELNLYRKENITENNVIVSTTSEKEWHSKKNRVIIIYEDLEYQAAFSVTTMKENKYMEFMGSFVWHNKTYSFKPAYQNIIKGEIKSYRVKINGTEYIVSESEDKIKFETNAEEAVVKKESENKMLKKKKKSGKSSQAKKDNKEKQKDKGKQGNKKEWMDDRSVIIEVYVVIDYSLYKRWFDYNKGKKEKTISHLKLYYAHVISGIDTKYRTIRSGSYTFSARLCGMYVIENKTDSFSEGPGVRVGEKLDYLATLQRLSEWMRDKILTGVITHFDVVASFTKYSSNATNDGLAYVNQTCHNYAVSLCRDSGVYGTVGLAAHEIGHNLGADHDGEGNTCNPDDQYIMTAVQTINKTNNHHTFSSCSIDAFNKHIIEGAKCLLSSAVGRTVDISKRTEEKLGLRFSPDEQCQHIIGPDSFFCSDGIKSDEKICEILPCFEQSTRRCRLKPGSFALDGTTCGNKKWCINKKCVYDDKAPPNKEKCLHGERRREFEFSKKMIKCTDLVNQQYGCKMEGLRSMCCITCEEIRKQNPEYCPYGEYPKCPQLKDSCYKEVIRNGCCISCRNSTNSTGHSQGIFLE